MRKLIYLVFMFVSFVANGTSLAGKAEATPLQDRAALEESAAKASGYNGPLVFTDAIENSQKDALQVAAHYSHRSHSSHSSHSSHYSSRF